MTNFRIYVVPIHLDGMKAGIDGGGLMGQKLAVICQHVRCLKHP